jgi:serine/threonine-protein kinase HipA
MILDVRLDGFDEPIGQLRSNERGDIAFGYSPAYLGRDDALMLSLAFPLTGERFDDFTSRTYFDNLLPERDSARADIVARHGLAANDIVGILYHLGRDCPGAVSVLPEGAPAVKIPGDLARDYQPYLLGELEGIVRSLHTRGQLPEAAQDPSPLAGVQTKIAVTRLLDNRFAAPKTGAPTTHILKIPQQGHERDVPREHLAMQLSSHSGFATASTEPLEFDGIPALLVERYDRQVDNGLVRRIHQEDYCQALGLPARLKYERKGSAARKFDVRGIRGLLDRTIDPAAEKTRFVDITLFDALIGNVDGHAKNFSQFHLPGNRIRTTPRYDVMPTMLDRGTTDEFAYRLGAATKLAELDPAALDAFLAELGLGTASGRRRIGGAATQRAIHSLNRRAGETGRADKNFGDLIATQIHTLCRTMGLAVPAPARDMDTFVR